MFDAHFDRFDIVEAYLLFESFWHDGGWDRFRPSNRRRMAATSVQVFREPILFEPAPSFGSFEALSDNGRDIYCLLVERYGLEADDDDYKRWARETQAADLAERDRYIRRGE